MTARSVVLVVGVAALLAGCGSSSATVTSSSGRSAGTFFMPASSVPTSCTAYLAGHDAEIQFQSRSFNGEPDDQRGEGINRWDRLLAVSRGSSKLSVEQPESDGDAVELGPRPDGAEPVDTASSTLRFAGTRQVGAHRAVASGVMVLGLALPAANAWVNC